MTQTTTVREPGYKPAAVALMCGVSERTVFRWMKAGNLLPIRIGGRVWVCPQSVERFMGGGEVGVTSG